MKIDYEIRKLIARCLGLKKIIFKGMKELP